ncbi:ATP-binding protein [Desulfuribacillus alkaliarsenatis]|uniref:Circadian input-output histidine kinase CikA n=1 Tax=Desulfuribacillus alkaliarsenatis TaxID=766136 RepID=A0A1E5G2X5_9FIRM|nr:ATP-binding protein [Desulfuribacillus alkaliarsenatis]OEF97426.1 hypothetical protein BHF68_04245 [Desulfuribacillus alkaliarsenatis]
MGDYDYKGFGILRKAWIVVMVWSIIVAVSLLWNLWHAKSNAYEIAENTLRMSSTKDLTFRYWATNHGGVYVPVTGDTPASPYLSHIHERDITTESGRELTLVNPAYMMRQVHELITDTYGIRGRLVSRQPVNPINLADEWEFEALAAMEAGMDDVTAVINTEGQSTMRYLKPFYVDEGCLLCHEHQGYQVGDLRGGISAQTSLEPYLAMYRVNRNNIVIGHVFVLVIGIIGVLLTASRLEKATKVVVKAERYKTIVEHTNDAIFMHDFNGVILDLNDKGSSVLGYSRKELIGEHLSKLVKKEIEETRHERTEKIINLGSLIFEGIVIHKNGKEIPVEISAKMVSNQGNGIIQSYVRDISKRKKVEQELLEANKKLQAAMMESCKLAEAAEKANRAKSEFLANMSHEIRTPMNAVLGMTELLEEYATDKEQQKYIDILKKNGDNLLKIINSILDLSKIESGKMELNVGETVICDVIKEVGATFKPLAAKKGLNIDIELSRCTLNECTVLADEEKIRQVLVNFISNAIKFTEQGDILLKFKIIDKTLRFSVQDSGIGISEEKLEDIFHAFNRGDVSTKQTYGGTGLGLTISKKLVEIMGGQIWVESVKGAGSTFYFEIPYVQSEQTNGLNGQDQAKKHNKLNNFNGATEATEAREVTEEAKLRVAPEGDSYCKRMLLVEDHEDNRALIMAYLKKERVLIDVAVNGQEAVEKYIAVTSDSHEKPYDAILMDMQMPIKDGYEATKEIRALERTQGAAPVKIIALTAYALAEDKQKSLEAGCDEHVTKPIKKQVLIDLIKKI